VSPEQTRKVYLPGSDEPGSEVKAVRYAGTKGCDVWFLRLPVNQGGYWWAPRGPGARGKRRWADLVREHPVVDCTDEVRRG
jgi:hypothetical protein